MKHRKNLKATYLEWKKEHLQVRLKYLRINGFRQ